MKVLVVWWLTCVIWSTVWLAIKLGVTDVPPFGFAASRLAIAIAVLAIIVIARRIEQIVGVERDQAGIARVASIQAALTVG